MGAARAAPLRCQASRVGGAVPDFRRGLVGIEQGGVGEVGQVEVLAHELQTQPAGESACTVTEATGVGRRARVPLVVVAPPPPARSRGSRSAH